MMSVRIGPAKWRGGGGLDKSALHSPGPFFLRAALGRPVRGGPVNTHRLFQQPLQHHPRHLLRLGCIGLKERTRPDAERFPRQHFLHRLAMYSEAGPGELLDDLGGRIWLHEHMATGSATADQHLWSWIGHLPERANNAVDL